MYFRSGYAKARINLREVELRAGELSVVSPGTVLQILEISPDCDLAMLAISNRFMENWQKEELLMSYLSGRLRVRIVLEEAEQHRTEAMLALLWEVTKDVPFPKAILQSLVSALFHQIECFKQKRQEGEKQDIHGRKKFSTGFSNLLISMPFVNGMCRFMLTDCILLLVI